MISIDSSLDEVSVRAMMPSSLNSSRSVLVSNCLALMWAM